MHLMVGLVDPGRDLSAGDGRIVPEGAPIDWDFQSPPSTLSRTCWAECSPGSSRAKIRQWDRSGGGL